MDDLQRAVGALQRLYDQAAAIPEPVSASDMYVNGYRDALYIALSTVQDLTDTPAEMHTQRVLDQRAGTQAMPANRCFVERIVNGRTVLLATCQRGMEHDRQAIGQDHTTAVNPYLDAR